ncbi:peptidoglycan hydrolase-like protein with peptidoglycan-binding domain [Nonomuraea muscovyensis]|uniref:Peptidoglycan hydrolase-like protein with peptidoglycan-binding domain n=1 Tax=Nonomuraea muscovyensis TaxID=1124761 RepID=A0A7X0F0Z2_9ACTN|nr:peptidoglycan-binding protein [Nonomuraea muscovyensis]MBB6349039.1 peptidoglycan hydrolase-like protein with peptidoglycan-binding domain [Nonomuraea muscovyensis]
MGRTTLGDPPAAGTDPPASGTEPPSPRPRRRRGRRAAVLLTAVALTGAAAVTVTNAGLLEGGGAEPAAAALPPATTRITEQTLDDTRDVDGELGYGPATTAVSRRPGTITWLPDSGARVSRGRSLYRVDNDPVVLLYGSTPAYRDLRIGAEGRDVENLERNLRELGYDGFTVDDTYTEATAAAVMEWQDDRGLDQTGVVELGRVVFAAGAVRVETLDAQPGQPTGPGRKVLSYTGTEKVVTVRLDAEDQRMAGKGAKVTVTLPDGGRVPGKVTEVATVIEPGDGPNAEPQTRLEALVSLTGGKKAARKGVARLDQAAVDVTFTAARREDVLTVPVAALVALREGGFGVEVVEGTSTRYVAVETGLFAGGRVEISGPGLTAGMTVGMPR